MTKLVFKITITDVVRGSIADIDNASELMESIVLKFKGNEKGEISHEDYRDHHPAWGP